MILKEDYMEYNTGNFKKYMTKNPLKRKMISRLNEKIIKHIREALNICHSNSEKVTLLDAGCGEGFVSKLIYSKISNLSITALEYTKEALSIAKELIPNATLIQGDIMRMPFDDNAFDIVLCSEVLEHLPKPEAALKELIRVTRNTLIITVPNEPWFCMGNLLVLKNVKRLGNPIDHINHWTHSGFVKFLSNHSNEKWYMDKSFPWTIAKCVINNATKVKYTSI